MADRYRSNRSRRRKKRSPKRLGLILLFEVLLLVILAGSFYFITRSNRKVMILISILGENKIKKCGQ